MSENHDNSLPLVEALPGSLRAVDAFRRLAELPGVVFFDSAMRHSILGRWSFVAADPVEWIVVGADGSDALAILKQRISALPSHSPRANLPPFQGGFAGLLGFELGRSLERLPPVEHDEFRVPALAVGLYDVVLAFDHGNAQGWMISQGIPEKEPMARLARARERLAFFQEVISQGCDNTMISREGVGAGDVPPLAGEELSPQYPVAGGGDLRSNFSERAYLDAVRQAIEYIRAGDIFQVNLSQRLLHPAEASAVELYCRLRERNPAPFAGYFDAGQWQIISASPERFLSLDQGHVETRPIKGTRGRTRRPEADLFAGDELRASAKDRAENVMIVDLLRNDLSRACRPESVRVTQLCGLETYAYVQHLVSVVEGELRPECDGIDLLRGCFPGGSITGAPKIRAMEVISELERTARGAYCGSLGYIGLDGRMDTSILIRTITSSRGWWQFPVGGGIVADSNPEDELAETWHKARGILRALVE